MEQPFPVEPLLIRKSLPDTGRRGKAGNSGNGNVKVRISQDDGRRPPIPPYGGWENCLRLRAPCASFPGNQENDEQNLCFVHLNNGGELTSSSSSASPCPKTEGIGETLSPPVQRRWIGELQLIPPGGHLNHPPERTEDLLFPIGKAQLPHPP